uniref:UBX domain-containing protein n=1 Tax=Globodera rostochiensis TaxID=31243 RepID=A0A914H6G9_GLORO
MGRRAGHQHETELGQNGENNCAKIAPSANYRWRIQQNGNNTTESHHRTSIFKVPSERSCSSALKFDHDQMLKENEINEMLETVRHSIRSTQGTVNRPHNTVFEQLPASSTAERATFEQLSAAHRAGLKFNTRMDLGQELVFDDISRVPPTQSSSSTSTMEVENGLKNYRSLKTLYRPPVELMFRGDWEQALELAKTKKVWLLVNVQNALEFASAKMNRDIWGVETVQEIIKTNFILWQVYHDSSDGIRIRSYYGLEESYPIIFIVDPRTGEEVQRLRAPDESFFLDLLTTFLAENSTFEARDRQFHEKNGQSKKQHQSNREHIDGPGSSWTPSELSSDEWTKWTVKEEDLVSPCPGTVQLSLRLPNGLTERVRMWKAAPLSAFVGLPTPRVCAIQPKSLLPIGRDGIWSARMIWAL